MSVGALCSTAMSILANWLVLVPFYRQLFFHGSWAPLVGPMQALFGEKCTEATFYNFYLWASVLPFNLMRCLIAVAVTLPVYKHVSRLINKIGDKLSPPKPVEEEQGETRAVNREVIITAVVCAVAVALLIGGVLLRYFLTKN